jgi:hypothetical protein
MRIKALGYTSKCVEDVPGGNRTWIAGVPIRLEEMGLIC